jgi:hypothetical protein
MKKSKALMGKLFLFMSPLIFFTFISSATYAAEIREIWNHISINNTEFRHIDLKTKNIWKEFENSSIQRGMVVKPNYQPFVPVVNRIILLDTPAEELPYRNYCLRIETEVVDGKDVRITEITLSKISDTRFPEATVEQHIGYAGGKLRQSMTYWVTQKRIIPEKLNAFEQLNNLENFKRAIELDYSGYSEYRRVPLKDIFYFFPELSNEIKLNFEYLYPQNDKPMFKTTYEPGRIRFGSLLDSDVKISYMHNIITGKMVHGEISWKTTYSKFTTAEEDALCRSFFYFMQESLAKEGLIAPAIAPLF